MPGKESRTSWKRLRRLLQQEKSKGRDETNRQDGKVASAAIPATLPRNTTRNSVTDLRHFPDCQDQPCFFSNRPACRIVVKPTYVLGPGAGDDAFRQKSSNRRHNKVSCPGGSFCSKRTPHPGSNSGTKPTMISKPTNPSCSSSMRISCHATLIAQRCGGNVIEQNPKKRQSQMDRLLNTGLDKTAKLAKVEKNISDAINIVLSVKEAMGCGLQAVPVAALAWTGVCIALQASLLVSSPWPFLTIL